MLAIYLVSLFGLSWSLYLLSLGLSIWSLYLDGLSIWSLYLDGRPLCNRGLHAGRPAARQHSRARSWLDHGIPLHAEHGHHRALVGHWPYRRVGHGLERRKTRNHILAKSDKGTQVTHLIAVVGRAEDRDAPPIVHYLETFRLHLV